MTAEAIARVAADLRRGRIFGTEPDIAVWANRPWEFASVVDATAIYRSVVATEGSIRLYEDHPCIAPPWEMALVSYVNEHGNVVAMAFGAIANAQMYDGWNTVARAWRDSAAENGCDWSNVKWITNTLLYIGGRAGTGRPIPTTGPVHSMQYAIYADGRPADLHYVNLDDRWPLEHWENAQLVLLGALNFMNCRNVELVEPRRPRPEARRIARTGVTVSTINVFPIGRSTRSRSTAGGVGVPLTSVRGHFASYGPEHNRGLLFGKYAGRYWIPQHARGSSDIGEVRHDYDLHPEAS